MTRAASSGSTTEAAQCKPRVVRAYSVRAKVIQILIAICALVPGALAARAPPSFTADVIEHGRYLAVAGDCIGCHTKPGGRAFAGGYAIRSPMGTIFSSNITPSMAAGIGGYTQADFARALRKGIRRDGANLYPAMPYTAYQALSDTDIGALYAYFMTSVARVDVAAPGTNLSFPFNLRFSVAGWNLLFLADKRFAADPARSAAWNRGAYLVGPLEHCGVCHTPRKFLMDESTSRPFAGGSLGVWYAPNITSDKNGGVGAWSRSDILRYLKTGATAHAQAAGGMAEAITNSLQYLTDADLDAITTYVQSIAPIADLKQTSPRTAQGRAVEFEPVLRGGPVVFTSTTTPTGEMLYSGNCATCHGAIGGGSAKSAFPSLYRNSATGAWRADNLVAAILDGVQRDTVGHRSYMPNFGKASSIQSLDDMEIATLSSFVLTSLGNRSAQVSASDVAVQRAGGSSAPLMVAVRWGMLVAVLILATIVIAVFYRRRSR